MVHDSPSSNEFKPTDDELIQVFLYNKINGNPLPNYATILEYDLYGEKNPWEIWEAFGGSNSYGGKDLYFFTNLKKKFLTGSRFVCTIGLGSWEAEDTGKKVVANGTNRCIGLKKRFRFEKSDTNHDGAWIMHEYSLNSSLLNNPLANNYVLCRFRKNERHNLPKTGTKRIRQEVVTRQKRTVVLGLVAPNESGNKNVGLGKDVHEETRNQPESIDGRTEGVETATTSNSDSKEQEDCALTMSWPELFSLQLRKINQGHLIQDQEDDIPMLPHTFYKDLLLEKIDNKYFGK